MDELKLMQDYFWILESCRDPDTIFANSPSEKEFASMWLSKLCNDIYRGIDAKRTRNLYLFELSSCIFNAKMSKLFMQTPPRGPLPPFEGASNIKIDHKTLVQKLQADALEYIPLNSPRHYETHMSTKIFDDNRGACAYLAVSLADPKDGPIWMPMGYKKTTPQESKSKKLVQQCPSNTCRNNNNNCNVDISFGEFCLDAIARELAGHASPCDCPELEIQLERYADFIQDYELGQEAKALKGSKLRNFLLLNLQTDLVRGLKSCH